MDATRLRLLSAGLDYVTCTAKVGPARDGLRQLGDAILLEEQRAGNARRGADWKGYRLERSGQASVGSRPQDVMLSLSGHAAYTYGPAALALADHASRTDLQLTMHSPRWDVAHLIRAAMYQPSAIARQGRPIARQYIDSSDAGSTCYLGSPRSDQRGRFYDKGKESPEEYDAGSARLEVQYRKAAADAVREEYRAGTMTPRRIAGTVATWFQSRGVLTEVRLPVGDPIKPPARDETDYERHRRWLRESVAPAIRRWRHVAPPRAVLYDLGIDEWGDILDDEPETDPDDARGHV